jgi:hypothetical protein
VARAGRLLPQISRQGQRQYCWIGAANAHGQMAPRNVQLRELADAALYLPFRGSLPKRM